MFQQPALKGPSVKDAKIVPVSYGKPDLIKTAGHSGSQFPVGNLQFVQSAKQYRRQFAFQIQVIT